MDFLVILHKNTPLYVCIVHCRLKVFTKINIKNERKLTFSNVFVKTEQN